MIGDRENMLKNLLTVRRDLLLQLADEAMDRDSVIESDGWRYLAGRGLWPAEHKHGWIGWRCTGRGGFAFELPGIMFDRLKHGRPKKCWRRYPGVDAALCAAAHACGQGLAEVARREQERRLSRQSHDGRTQLEKIRDILAGRE